jgi:hypothetical protein
VVKVTSTKATQAYHRTQRFSRKVKPMLGYLVLGIHANPERIATYLDGRKVVGGYPVAEPAAAS